jgi:hypothetical protein
MHGKRKLVDIWCVFRIWVLEKIFGKTATMRDASQFKQVENLINNGDFICVTYILCVETLKHLNYA